MSVPPLPDSSTAHVHSETGKPTKDFFNWLKALQSEFSALQTDVTNLQAQACFSAHKNGTNQTGVVSAAPTAVTWSTEIYDVGNYFASDGWTPPAGKIHLDFGVEVSGTLNTGVRFTFGFLKNGSSVKTAASLPGSGAAFGVVSIDDVANGTDVYKTFVTISTTSGTATVVGTATNTWFMGHRIGP